MALTRLSAIAGGGVELAQAVFLTEGLNPDITINGSRFLQSGFIETDDTLFDTNVFTGKRLSNTVDTNTGLPDGVTIYDIIFTENEFLAVAGNGFLYRSLNGAGYTGVNTTLASPRAFAYGAGLYVVLGVSTSFVTSPDGIVWTTRTLPVSSSYEKVIFANGLFVAVGSGAVVITSPDGITWTQRSITATNPFLRGVAYGNGVYVVAAYAGKVQTSPDGITWTERSTTGGNNLYAIAFDGETFCASGAAGFTTKSTDGITWAAVTGPNVDTFEVTYSEVWVFAGATGKVFYSRDLVTFESFQVAEFSGANFLGCAAGAGTVSLGSSANTPSGAKIDLIPFAGSPTPYSENGENQYIRIS